MPRRSLSEMFDRLEVAETQFTGREFLAPIIGGSEVQVRMAGIVCRLKIEPRDFRGWGVFQPVSMALARFRRTPTLSEQQQYLRLFPGLLLVLCERVSLVPKESHWQAIAAHWGDKRFRIEGTVPIRMVEEAEQFDVVRARFDGTTFWYESLDPAHDLSKASYLRASLREMLPPEELNRSGLTPEERAAYTRAWNARQEAKKVQERDRTETRLRSALAHAGAEFVDYLERNDSYRVTYRVGQRQMVTAVDKEDLSVQVAGICLSGEDEKFDLGSLVGVLREGGNHTVPIGPENRGMAEDAYWSIYRR